MGAGGRKRLHREATVAEQIEKDMSWGYVIAAIIAVVLGVALVLVGPATKAKAAVGSFSVVTLNVHGGTDSFGGGNGGEPAPVIADVLRLVLAHSPRMVSLQEICKRQYMPLKAELAKLGYEGRMGVAHETKGCNDPTYDGGIGVAVFVKGDLTWWDTYDLPWGESDGRGVQPRLMICVTEADTKGRLCGTHLTPSDPDRAAQAARIRRVVEIKGWKYVTLAGDLNMTYDVVAARFPGWSASGARIDHALTMDNGTSTKVACVRVENSDHPAFVARVSQG